MTLDIFLWMRFLWLKLLFVGLFKTWRIFFRFHKNHLAGNLFNSEYDFYSYLTITTHLNIFDPLNIFYNCTQLPEFGCIRRKTLKIAREIKNFPAELNQMTDKNTLAQCQPSVIWHFRWPRSRDCHVIHEIFCESCDLLIRLRGLYITEKYSSVISIVCKQRWIDIGCMPAIGRKQLGPFIRSPRKQKD